MSFVDEVIPPPPGCNCDNFACAVQVLKTGSRFVKLTSVVDEAVQLSCSIFELDASAGSGGSRSPSSARSPSSPSTSDAGAGPSPVTRVDVARVFINPADTMPHADIKSVCVELKPGDRVNMVSNSVDLWQVTSWTNEYAKHVRTRVLFLFSFLPACLSFKFVDKQIVCSTSSFFLLYIYTRARTDARNDVY